MFQKFWTLYPRKRARADAEKVWMKINPSAELIEIILSAVQRAKTSEDWLRERGKYIPYPATWLNRKQWEDEDTETHPLSGRVSDTTIRNIHTLNDWRPPE
jgi:hypothetical protein